MKELKKCPICNGRGGTGKIVADLGAFEFKEEYDNGLKFWVDDKGMLITVTEGTHAEEILTTLQEEGVLGQVMMEAEVPAEDVKAFEEGGLEDLGDMNEAAFNWADEHGWVRVWNIGNELAIEADDERKVTKTLEAIAKQKPALLVVKTLMAWGTEISVDEGEDAQTAWDHRNSVRKRVAAGLTLKGGAFSSVGYHGTSLTSEGGVFEEVGAPGEVYYIATAEPDADWYATEWKGAANLAGGIPAVIKGRLSLKNALIINEDEDTVALKDQSLDLGDWLAENFLANSTVLENQTYITDWASQNGYDGVVFVGGFAMHGAGDDIAVFAPNSFKEQKIKLKDPDGEWTDFMSFFDAEQMLETEFQVEVEAMLGRGRTSSLHKWWVSPEGKLFDVGGPNSEHIDDLQKIAPEVYEDWNKNWLGTSGPLDYARDYGWARISTTRDALFIQVGDEAIVEKVLSVLPQEMRFRDTLVVDTESVNEVREIPVLEGEDALDAWKHRNDVRHRVEAMLDQKQPAGLWYHGTPKNFESLDPKKSNAGVYGRGTYFYQDSTVGSAEWAGVENGGVFQAEIDDQQLLDLFGYDKALGLEFIEKFWDPAKKERALAFLDGEERDRVFDTGILNDLSKWDLVNAWLAEHSLIGFVDRSNNPGSEGAPIAVVRIIDSVKIVRVFKGPEIQAKLNPALDTPDFKEWFAGSKIVDRNGDPLLLQHGTDVSGIERFESNREGEDVMPGILFFTTSAATARSYGPIRYTVALNITNPMVFDAKGQSYEQVSPFWLAKEALDAGHDGLVVKNIRDDATYKHQGDTYVVWNSDQVWKVDERGKGGVTVEQRRAANEESRTEMAELTKKNQEKEAKVKEAWLKTPEGKKWKALRSSIKGMAVRHHGSPHKFKDFKLDRVGSGEGYQAYGWGIYFAEERAVAESYQKRLGQDSNNPPVRYFKGVKLEPGTPEYHAATLLSRNGETLARARKEVQGWIDEHDGDARYANEIAGWHITLDTLNQARSMRDFKEEPPEGYLYVADIPDDDQLLDWDVMVRDQPARVRAKLVKTPEYQAADERAKDGKFKRGDDLTGGEFYGGLKEYGGRTAKEASLYLLSLGVPGLRYLDQESRGSGGTHNYVIWDEAAIREEQVAASVKEKMSQEEFDKMDKEAQGKVIDDREAAVLKILLEDLGMATAFAPLPGFKSPKEMVSRCWSENFSDHVDGYDDQDPRTVAESFRENFERAYWEVEQFTHQGTVKVFRVLAMDDAEAQAFVNAAKAGNPVANRSGFGIYWSHNADSAESYWGHGNNTITLEGEASKNSVDWEATLIAQTKFGDEEDEITLKEGAPVTVHKLTWVKSVEGVDTLEEVDLKGLTVKAANKFNQLYKTATAIAQDDAKYSGALENPALAQEQGQFQQAVKDARSEAELQQAWTRFQPAVGWDALQTMVEAGNQQEPEGA